MTPLIKAGQNGWGLYATLLRAVIDGPSTSSEIAQRTQTNKATVRTIMRRLRGLRLTHVAGYGVAGSKNTPVPRWGYGDLPDAPLPTCLRSGREVNHQSTRLPPIKPRAELITFATIVRELQGDAPLTVPELASLTGINRAFAYTVVRHFRELGLVRIADWAVPMRSGMPVAMYEFAVDEPDRPRPAKGDRKARARVRDAGRRERARQQRALHALAANSSIFTLARQAA